MRGLKPPPPSVPCWIRFGFVDFVPSLRDGVAFCGRLTQGDALGYFRFLPTGDWEAVPPVMGAWRTKSGTAGFIVPRSQKRDLGHPFIPPAVGLAARFSLAGGSCFPTLAAKTRTRRGWGTRRFGVREFRPVPTGRGGVLGRLSQGDALGYFRFSLREIGRPCRLRWGRGERRAAQRGSSFPGLKNETWGTHSFHLRWGWLLAFRSLELRALPL
jgi:hypothetical protein